VITSSKKKTKKRAPGTPRAFMSKRDLHLLEGATLAVFAVLIVGAFLITSVGGIFIRSGQSAAVVSAVLVDLTNQERASNSLGGLTINPTLVEAAQQKANDEAAKGYFAHISPEGIDSWYWFKTAGYAFTYAGENLAVDFSDSANVVTAWMNSPTHRANILDSHYTEIGIATASGMYEGHPTIFVVQEFGTPSESATVAAVPITQESLPSEPTQIAVATTKPADTTVTTPATPRVLGDTVRSTRPVVTTSVAKVATPATVVTTDTVLPQVPTISVHTPLADAAHPVSRAIAGSTVEHYASPWSFFLMSPETTLRYAYYAIAFMVLCALLLTTELEFKMHHFRHMAVAGGLVALMLCLFVVADRVVFRTATIAVVQSVTAS
jgi:hypothetical protein